MRNYQMSPSVLLYGNFHRRHPRVGHPHPLFTIRSWNQCERTENGISRTNNKVEDCHNAFSHLYGGNHPNIFEFVATLQRELSLIDVLIDTLYFRATQPNTRSVYNQTNRQLIELMEQRGTILTIILLDQISYLLTSYK
ncbi:hypothetical protein HZS_2578 [Henneguya salminicola]|nr:hypothetical protein HZS_2578 [Henneguya salminicola]